MVEALPRPRSPWVRRIALASCLLCVLGLSACGKGDDAPRTRSEEPNAPLPAVRATLPEAPAPSAAKSPGCRVMSLEGSITTGGGALLKKGEVLSGERLSLPAGAVLRLKHTASGREASIEGPARILPCAGGEEDMIVGLGTLRIQAHSGVRPGAQVVVGTPFGSLRYVDAQATLRVEASALSATDASGMLSFVPPASDAEAVRVTVPAWRSEQAPPTAEATLATCSERADNAASKARELMARGTSALGKLAAEHVRARQQARVACATATASALSLSRDEDVTAALGRLRELGARWRDVPSGP
jgi:hypothetical protein